MISQHIYIYIKILIMYISTKWIMICLRWIRHTFYTLYMYRYICADVMEVNIYIMYYILFLIRSSKQQMYASIKEIWEQAQTWLDNVRSSWWLTKHHCLIFIMRIEIYIAVLIFKFLIFPILLNNTSSICDLYTNTHFGHILHQKGTMSWRSWRAVGKGVLFFLIKH